MVSKFIIVRKRNCAVCNGKVWLDGKEKQVCKCGAVKINPTLQELRENYDVMVIS